MLISAMTQLFYMIFLELIWKKRIWSVLYDPNTLPLHYIFDFKESILNLCIMPKYSTSLDTLIRRSEFLADREGLISIHRWLKNSAKGLHYFYYKGFVHLKRVSLASIRTIQTPFDLYCMFH